MIVWFCDICGKRMGDSTEKGLNSGESVMMITAYSEGVNKRLEGYGHSDHIFDNIYVCVTCKSRVESAMLNALQALRGGTELIWNAVLDENTCDECRALHGKPIHEIGITPPLHGPNDPRGRGHCRCAIIVREQVARR